MIRQVFEIENECQIIHRGQNVSASRYIVIIFEYLAYFLLENHKCFYPTEDAIKYNKMEDFSETKTVTRVQSLKWQAVAARLF